MSIQSKLLTFLLKMIRIKTKCLNVADEISAGSFKSMRTEPTAAQLKRFNIEKYTIDGIKVWQASPKHGASNQHVLYLHGGAYVHGFARQHWNFIFQLAQNTKCTVTAPDYPLGPDYTVDDAITMGNSLYASLVQQGGAENLTVMGDSAGAGLALSLAQQALHSNTPQAKHLVLISPWLDASLSNPEIEAVNRIDPFLSAEGLAKIAHIYAGTHEVTNPLISPIFGDIKGLAPTTLFIGTHDIFIADCRKFRDRAVIEGLKLNYHETENMIHAYALFGIPEAKEPLKIIESIVSNT